MEPALSLDRPAVVVVHPGANFAYQMALAAQEGGMLQRLVTGTYYKPDKFPYVLVSKLPGRLQEDAIRQLKRRQLDDMDSTLVDTLDWLELLRTSLFRVPILRPVRSKIGVAALTSWYGAVFDWYASRIIPRPSENIVVAFQGVALRTLRKAQQSGLVSVLDEANALNAQQIVAEEYGQHGLSTQRSPSSMKSLIAEAHLADWITAPSEFVVNSLVNVGVAREKVALVPFGVDANRFRPAPPTKERRPFTVLYVGQLSLRKGVHYLLKAWRDLQLENARLYLMGSAVDHETQVLLDRYAGLYQRIPDVPHHELHQYYQQSDLFVFPSLAEGSALVTYEALASGLPCIVTEASGSIVRDRVDGLVVPSRDAGALQTAIRELRDSPELRLSLARAGRRRAEEFPWSRYREGIRRVYERAWMSRSAALRSVRTDDDR